MKNIKLILTFLLLAAVTVSCDTDGGESELDLRVGAIPDITQNEDLATILNFLDLQEGIDSDFGFTVEVEQGDVTSADVVALYQKANGDLYGPVTLEEGITEFPSEFSYSTTEMVNAFSELNSLEDFELGDVLIITAKLYLQDGTEINMWDEDGRLYGSDLHSASIYNVASYYSVGCPLDESFLGEYRITVEGSGGFGAFADSGIVTFEEVSQTQRSFDFTYLPEIGGFAETLTLNFVCDHFIVPVVDTGLACGGPPSLKYGSTDDGVEIDPEDDSGFTINISDNIDGGCGGSPYSVTLTFEKI